MAFDLITIGGGESRGEDQNPLRLFPPPPGGTLIPVSSGPPPFYYTIHCRLCDSKDFSHSPRTNKTVLQALLQLF